jgi:hypothetical protein
MSKRPVSSNGYKKLSLVQMEALSSAMSKQVQVAQLVQQSKDRLTAIMLEMGLDPMKVYDVLNDGTVMEKKPGTVSSTTK